MEDVKKELGLKETMEGLEAIEILAVGGAKVFADGKIRTDDIVTLVDVAKKSDTILEGVKDIDMSIEELKDLDQEEVVKIIFKVMEMIKAVKAAKESAK